MRLLSMHPYNSIWAVITDINLLHKVNSGGIKATGRMDKEGETRVCHIDNNGKAGMMTERLIEPVPGKKTVWTIETDTMGMSKMLRDARFCFILEKLDADSTKVINESYYRPANIIVSIMNTLMIKKKMKRIQQQILLNIQSIVKS